MNSTYTCIGLILLIIISTSYYTLAEDFVKRVEDAYIRALRLNEVGFDTSNIVSTLNSALTLYNQGDIVRASNTLTIAEQELSRLEASNPPLIREYHLRLSIALLLLFFPILAYFSIPLLYLELWFRLRRSWRIEYTR